MPQGKQCVTVISCGQKNPKGNKEIWDAAYGNEIKEVPRKKEEERQDIVFPLHKDSILLVEFPFLVMAGKEEAYAIMSSSLTAASQSWITQRLLG